MSWIILAVILVFLILVLVPAAIKIVMQYEAGVVFRLGRLVGSRQPGIRVIIPFIDQMRKVDTRVITLDVPAQEVITKDNVTVKVNAVVYFRVVHPESSIIEVMDFRLATYQIAQTTLRSVLGKSTLDDLLAERDKLNEEIRGIIDDHTDPWGIKVTAVEVKDVELPQTMQRAMAAQAEAERERRAKVIHAEGEYQAAERLAQAAAVIQKEPAALQLRYLSTLIEVASEKNSTLVFPIPIDIIAALTGRGSVSSGEKK
jgi:regulator of protease activity HflC (stomatin/prohibitin superfamily)